MFKALKEHPAYKEMDFNLFINWLKHQGGPETATISEFKAAIIITRSITKFVAAYRQSCELFEEFLRWGHSAGHLPRLFKE